MEYGEIVFWNLRSTDIGHGVDKTTFLFDVIENSALEVELGLLFKSPPGPI